MSPTCRRCSAEPNLTIVFPSPWNLPARFLARRKADERHSARHSLPFTAGDQYCTDPCIAVGVGSRLRSASPTFRSWFEVQAVRQSFPPRPPHCSWVSAPGSLDMAPQNWTNRPCGATIWMRGARQSVVLPHIWCKSLCSRHGVSCSRSGGGEQPASQQGTAGAAIHLPLDRLQPVDLTFDLASAPGLGDRRSKRLDIAADAGCQ
jgi:hypothetical protein